MTIRGFSDSGSPLNIYIDDVIGAGSGPFAINPVLAESSDAGILCNIADTRYFVPWAHVRIISQLQPVQPAAPAPTQLPLAPAAPHVDAGG